MLRTSYSQMTTDSVSIQQALQNASEAMRRGDKHGARHWAQLAVSLAPQLEEPWLILAAVASPQAAIEYLKQALLVHPGSERAMRGLRWAQEQLAKQAPRPAAGSDPITRPLPSATQPIRVARPAVVARSATQPLSRPATRKPVSRRMLIAKQLSIPAVLLTLMLCSVAAWAVWPGSNSSALALIHSGAGPAWSQAEIAKPSATPLPTASPLPTQTPLPSPTLTAIPTDTQQPTALPTDLPTAQPTTAQVATIGTYTVRSGDSLSGIAQRAGVSTAELAAANQISPYATIYPGQVLGIPQGGVVPDAVVDQPAPDPGSDAPATAGGQYILVDLSEQHLYAYQDNTLVFSFVASTGMNNATRVGVFHIQDKIPNAYGATWNIWMPNWMGIYYAGGLENGIHALPILSNGSRLWAGYLGTPISFGCIVLGVDEAQELYDWAQVGATVEIQP